MQEELSTTENKIAFARQYYNDSVQKLNTLRSTFPLLLLKNVAPAKDFFEADATEKEVPKVKF
jgi:LemA protein